MVATANATTTLKERLTLHRTVTFDSLSSANWLIQQTLEVLPSMILN